MERELKSLKVVLGVAKEQWVCASQNIIDCKIKLLEIDKKHIDKNVPSDKEKVIKAPIVKLLNSETVVANRLLCVMSLLEQALEQLEEVIELDKE